MTISSFAAGSFVNDRNTASLLTLKSRLDTLSTQLVTGKTAQTYGGLGAGRVTSLGARATIGALEGYAAAASAASTRVTLASTSLTLIKKFSDTTRTDLLTSLQTTNTVGINNSVAIARSSFDAAVDALNQQVAGQYIFSGRATDTEPVPSTDLIFEGDVSKGLSGLKDLIAEQRQADLGSAGNGRLTQGRTGATVTLAEDTSAEARANFGFRLVNVSSSNTQGIAASIDTVDAQGGELRFAELPADGARVRVAVLLDDGSQKVIDLTARKEPANGVATDFAIGATADGSATNLKTTLKTILGTDAKIASIQSADPPRASLTFPADGPGSSLAFAVKVPAFGDKVTVTLGMRDGTTTTVTLTASADQTSSTGFKIDTTGATPEARAANTAANLNEALAKAVKAAAQTELSASSAQRAAENFFDGSGSAGLAPRRVDGTGYAATARADTVIWYKGDDTASDPRSTATVQVGTQFTVAIGAQANEQPIRATLASLAALAAGTFTNAAGAQDVGRFTSAAQRAADALGPTRNEQSVADLVTEFGLAASNMSDAKSQALATKALLEDSVDAVESVSTEEVAAKLLTLQTQLQASYQVTSTLSKLTLVNYM